MMTSFQSTPSTRRETNLSRHSSCGVSTFQSTPSTRRETRNDLRYTHILPEFQSTPSTRRETNCYIDQACTARNFNPLPPHGGRQNIRTFCSVARCISIHSLHTEGDHNSYVLFRAANDFNPLPPHGGRQGRHIPGNLPDRISIHSLHTEGDVFRLLRLIRREISIHSLHTEGDMLSVGFFPVHSDFNPLPPHGGRRR